MMDALTPFGVVSEYSCRRSGCLAGHLRVIGNAERSAMIVSSIGARILSSRCPFSINGAPTSATECRHAGLVCRRELAFVVRRRNRSQVVVIPDRGMRRVDLMLM